MKKIIIMLTALVLSLAVQAQCGEKKPDWASAVFHKPLEKSYLETVVIKGSDQQQIRVEAQEEIERRRRITVGADDAWVKSKPITEYWECKGNEYTGYFLYQTRNPNMQDKDVESVTITDKYPFSARVFVPGMAQIHKGSIGKGVGFIVGETLLIGGIVVAESLRADYFFKINTTHNAAAKRQYIDNANLCENVRNGLIAGAAALYVWNVIDGIVAKGKKHIRLTDNASLRIMPYATPETGGIYLSLNF